MIDSAIIPIVNLNSLEPQGSMIISQEDADHMAGLMVAGVKIKLEATICPNEDGSHSLKCVSLVWNGCINDSQEKMLKGYNNE